MSTLNLSQRIKQAQGSSYNFERCIYEFIDNFREDVTEIHVILEVYNDKILKIKISDNSKISFNEKEFENVFNWTAMGQTEKEISNFGVGFKSASVNLGDKLTLYTKKENDYYQIEADWRIMSAENTQIPVITKLHKDSYYHYHPFEYGSTFIITELFSSMCDKNSFEELNDNIKRCYNYLLDDIKIIVKLNNLNDKNKNIKKEHTKKFNLYDEIIKNKLEIIKSIKTIDENFNDNIFKKIYYNMKIYIKEKNNGKYFIFIKDIKGIYYDENFKKTDLRNIIDDINGKFDKDFDTRSNLEYILENIDFKSLDVNSHSFWIFNKDLIKIGLIKIENKIEKPEIIKKYDNFNKVIYKNNLDIYFKGRLVGKKLSLTNYQSGDYNHIHTNINCDNKKIALDLGLNMIKNIDKIKIKQFEKLCLNIQKKCANTLLQYNKLEKYFDIPLSNIDKFIEYANKNKNKDLKKYSDLLLKINQKKSDIEKLEKWLKKNLKKPQPVPEQKPEQKPEPVPEQKPEQKPEPVPEQKPELVPSKPKPNKKVNQKLDGFYHNFNTYVKKIKNNFSKYKEEDLDIITIKMNEISDIVDKYNKYN